MMARSWPHIAKVEDLAPLANILGNFGLPGDREQLTALVARLRKSERPDAELHAYMHGEAG
jgi:hypothetical protein